MTKTKFDQGELWLGDCLELMKDIPDGSIDMILCDLPYGTTQNKWDVVIPFEPLWDQYWRVVKPNAAIVLTASQPFTSILIMSQLQYFKYNWIWIKNTASGHLNSKKQPMRNTEEIVVFYKTQPIYCPQMIKGKFIRMVKNITNASTNYGDQKPSTYESDMRYPRQTLEFDIPPNSKGKIHPTQKPVALFEYLIKTYTNEGELVLDNCSGSGTTSIAAINTNRKFLCIEKDEKYYELSKKRIEEHTNKTTLLDFIEDKND